MARILWFSNAPWSGSGYGVQTALMTRWLKQAGHELILGANYGLNGAPIRTADAEILPGAYVASGDDVIAAHYVGHRPDVLIVLYDIWVFSENTLRRAPVSAYAPVDQKPIPRQVADKLALCRHTLAMSQFGMAEMKRIGLDPLYLPHAVDTSVFKPEDRVKAREKLNLKPDTFVVCTIAANKGYPPRKNLDRMIKAWSYFVKDHPDSVWLLHTNPRSVHGGIDVVDYLMAYDVPVNTIRLPDEYRLAMGSHTPDVLNTMLNAADVFWLPSGGEGFGTPALEAQASGCPVIVCDWTAQTELGEVGYKIPIDPVNDTLLTVQGGEMALPSIRALLTSLDWGYNNRNNGTLRTQAYAFAQQYDIQEVGNRYLQPAILQMAAMNIADRDRANVVVYPSRSLA